MFDDVYERDHILNRVGDEVAVIGIPLADQFEAVIGDAISLARDNEPSNERFHHKVKTQGR